MARYKKYEDEELRTSFERYWDTECVHDPRKLSYTGLARYLQKEGIDYDDNALKHRPMVVEMMRGLKAGGRPVKNAPVSNAENSAEYEALLKQNEQLLDLFLKAFNDQLCAQLLIDSGIVQEEKLGLRREVAKKATLKADGNIYENEWIMSLAKHSGTVEDKKERKDETYGES